QLGPIRTTRCCFPGSDDGRVLKDPGQHTRPNASSAHSYWRTSMSTTPPNVTSAERTDGFWD
ncbi:hypothetical protein J4Q44_G00019690, partial [Coregonus suidteri]